LALASGWRLDADNPGGADLEALKSNDLEALKKQRRGEFFVFFWHAAHP
jgi:hypothetical protein